MLGRCFSKVMTLHPDQRKRAKAANLDRDLDKSGSPEVFTFHFKALLADML